MESKNVFGEIIEHVRKKLSEDDLFKNTDLKKIGEELNQNKISKESLKVLLSEESKNENPKN
jgi:hypothetical protein